VFIELDNFEKMAATKGKFMLANNELAAEKLDDKMLFAHYKGQSKIERGFKFLKDPQFMAATLFVKKPQRRSTVVHHDPLFECLCSHRISNKVGINHLWSYLTQSVRKTSQKSNGSVDIYLFYSRSSTLYQSKTQNNK
jgi:transposase